VVETYEGIGRPNSLAKFLTRNYLARVLKQDRQYLERTLLDFDLLARPIKLTGAQVNFKISKLHPV
jgi:hypothetical protein